MAYLAMTQQNTTQIGDGTLNDGLAPVKKMENVIHAAIAPTFFVGAGWLSTRFFNSW